MLDTTDLSLHSGHTPDSPEGLEAAAYFAVSVHAWGPCCLPSWLLLLAIRNAEPLRRLNILQAHPMSEENPQMIEWNGGIGAKQMK